MSDVHFVGEAFDRVANVYPRVEFFKRGRGLLVKGSYAKGVPVHVRSDRNVGTTKVAKNVLPKGHYQMVGLRNEGGTMVFTLHRVNTATESNVRVY